MEELRRSSSRWRSWKRQLSALGNIPQCSEAAIATQFDQFPGISREIVPCFEYMDQGTGSSRLVDGSRRGSNSEPVSQRYHSVTDMLTHFRTMVCTPVSLHKIIQLSYMAMALQSGSTIVCKVLEIIGEEKHHLVKTITASILTRLVHDAENALSTYDARNRRRFKYIH
jgi:hypothetical protein